jgi:DUF1680 family protein
MRPLGKPRLTEVDVVGGFWGDKIDLVASATLPQQWSALNDEIACAEPSHVLENFRIVAGEAEGVHKGTIFQDSDVYKWMEAASYALEQRPDEGLEARLEEAIRLVGKAQGADGYVNTWFTLVAPDKRWTDLAWGHELYCAGHLIEAAVADRECRGGTTLLGIATRLADLLDRVFGPEEGKIHAACGHPEIELALLRLHKTTGEERYFALAAWFLEIRSADPGRFVHKTPLGFDMPKNRWILADYFLTEAPLLEQNTATGHAVRAMYLYAAHAAALLARREIGSPEEGSETLAALERLWESAVSRRMYITGALGSQAMAERFTLDYDLPSDTAYAETCASVGLAFWAERMGDLTADSRYADVVERVAYNGVLSGISEEGTRYFYVNPLAVDPAVASYRHDHEHVKTARVEWLGCSCCPPNIARFIASFGGRVYGLGEDTVYVHHYCESRVRLSVAATSLELVQRGDYPWSGRIVLELAPEIEAEFALALRIPDWCDGFECRVDGQRIAAPVVRKGYLFIEGRWKRGSRVELDLEMPCRLMRAHPAISELAGKVAIQRGPLVYCVEGCDNGPRLHELLVDTRVEARVAGRGESKEQGSRITLAGFRDSSASGMDAGRAPYAPLPVREGLEAAAIVAVPYHRWGNRASGGEMTVWLRALEKG